MQKVILQRDDAIWTMTINRPEVHNCIDGETAEKISEAIQEFADSDTASVLVITGAGEKSFSSGADLKNIGTLSQHRYRETAGPLGFARLDPGKPTIAAVNGYCFAGGFELALWCDFRIASANAEFGVLNRRWGVPLIDGGTQRLARIAGTGTALFLIETGARVGAERALQMGIVQEVVNEGVALGRAVEWATAITTYPQASLRSDRRAAIDGLGLPLQEGLELEASLGLTSAGSDEMARGLARYESGDRPDAPR
jgi:enoyl-CoA hydratase